MIPVVTSLVLIIGLVCAIRCFVTAKKHNDIDCATRGIITLFSTAIIILGITVLANPNAISTESTSDESLWQSWYWFFCLPFILKLKK